MGVTESFATGEPYRNVYNALSQTHLPTLDNAKIVRYDQTRQVVEGASRLPIAVLLVNIGSSLQETFDQQNWQTKSNMQSPIEYNE